MALPALSNIETAKRLYEMLKGWKLANKAISSFFEANPKNTDERSVLTKVVLLNGLYYTNIKEPLRMAKHVQRLDGLDARLQAGEAAAVEQIAKDDRYYVSFASKYAHFHNKTAFPLYDRFVEDAIGQLMQGRRLSLRPYSKFLRTIKEFCEQAGLSFVSWDDFDKYLWLYGQKKALDKGGRAIGREVRELYDDVKIRALFERLEP